MIDVTLTINGRDFSDRLSTYQLRKEQVASRLITALDGTEYEAGKRWRDVLTFALIPFNEEVAQKDFDVLSQRTVEVTYTDPQRWTTTTRTMRVTSSLDAAFGLRSVNGHRYHKGGTITMRALKPG